MSTTIPPWDQLSFVFAWNANLTTTYTLPQCFNTTWQYWGTVEGRVSNPPPSPPYHGVIYAGGYQPYIIPFNNTTPTGESQWIANLPVGPRFGISMMDSKDYSGGVLDQPLVMTPGTGCNLTNPLIPSSLDVEVKGSGQCQQIMMNVKNGTAPYMLEMIQMNVQQKTIHYASSPFTFILDLGANIEYYLAVYDAVGNSAVMGSYIVAASSDNSCLGEATTVSAGQVSTLYPGGTALATDTATATSAPSNGSHGLATPAVIGIAVAVPIVAIILTALLLWLCYRRNHQEQERDDKPEIEPGMVYPHAGYTPVSTTGPYTGSYHDVSSSGRFNAPAPILYPVSPLAGDGNTIRTSTSPPPSAGFVDKRQLVNPDAHNQGPIEVEPFDVSLVPGTASPQPRLPPLPPAYSPTS